MQLKSSQDGSQVKLRRSVVRWALIPLVAVIVLVADQLSKSWIRSNVPLGSFLAPFPGVEPWFTIVHYTNTGAAFGLLQGQGNLFILVAVIVIVAVLIYARQLPIDEWSVRMCLGLQLGGAVGNLTDRLRLGHVTDFLLFTLPVNGRLYQWPAFNVADSCIVTGVILLALLVVRSERDQVAPESDGNRA